MKTFKEYSEDSRFSINEVKMSRVWKHLTDTDTCVGIITGFRAENTIKQNLKANKEISQRLRKEGFGFFIVDGSWIEDEDVVKEDSIFTTGDTSSQDKLIGLMKEFSKKYDQDGYSFKKVDSTDYTICNRNGKVELTFDNVSFNKLADVYTKLRKGQGTFVFESAYTGTGFIGQLVQESSLSRIWQHNEEHDCGALTAHRKGRKCGLGDRYTNKENLARNKSMTAKLTAKGYGITRLHGEYPEGGELQKEISYFVVDLHDVGNLEDDLREIGEYFDQDSILYCPKGAVQNKVKAYLIGTNRCGNNWLGYGKKEIFEKGKMGHKSKIYTSYVNGRPFIFETVGKGVPPPSSGFGHWSMVICSEKDWQDLVQEEMATGGVGLGTGTDMGGGASDVRRPTRLTGKPKKRKLISDDDDVEHDSSTD